MKNCPWLICWWDGWGYVSLWDVQDWLREGEVKFVQVNCKVWARMEWVLLSWALEGLIKMELLKQLQFGSCETQGRTSTTAERKTIGEKSGIGLIEFDKFVTKFGEIFQGDELFLF